MESGSLVEEMWSGNIKILRRKSFKLYMLFGEIDVYFFFLYFWKSLYDIKDVIGGSVLCEFM